MMNAMAMFRATESIGARDLRRKLDQILRHPRAYRVFLHNKPTVAVVPDAVYLRLMEVIEELRVMGLLDKVQERLRREEAESAAWFWHPSWQAGEARVDRDVKAGRVKRAKSMREMFRRMGR